MSAALPMKWLEKPWGRRDLPDPFGSRHDRPIGEIWFEPTALTGSLMAKYLFTSEKLSVQVHPTDRCSPTGIGKDECWLVVHANAGARVALGFREELSLDELRDASRAGTIEQLLAWHPVAAGDFVYLPAGTVHTIGAGLTLVEVQENTDITYRLFDYGRPRELHLEEALRAVRTGPHPQSYRRRLDENRSAVLVDGPKFTVTHVVAHEGLPEEYDLTGPHLVLPLASEVEVNGQSFAPGTATECASLDDVRLKGEARCLVVRAVRPVR